MRFRIWDKHNNIYWHKVPGATEHGIFLTAEGNPGMMCNIDDAKDPNYKKVIVISPEFIVIQRMSDMVDMNGQNIYEGDIVKTMLDISGSYIKHEVKFGKVERVMATGATVEINGFYFQALGEEYEGDYARFSITKNWCGGHDLNITEVLGNIFENPELLK